MSKDIKILIVEDESIVSIDIQSILKKLDYNNTALVFNGEKAISKSLDWHPDVILMDIGLKGDIDGIEAAKKIIKRIKTAIIFLTGFADENTFAKADKVNPVDYVIKPINNMKLQDAISKAVI